MQKGRQWFEIGILLMEIMWGKRTAESERERERAEDFWCQARDSFSFACG